jgi:hypothetical protein
MHYYRTKPISPVIKTVGFALATPIIRRSCFNTASSTITIYLNCRVNVYKLRITNSRAIADLQLTIDW